MQLPLSKRLFLKKYWHKKPLLIRQAFPNFQNFVSKDALISLAGKEQTRARLVSKYCNQWHVDDGPFKKSFFTNLSGHWTLLVQDINHFLEEGEQLLKSFNFIPHARLDDLMISFAPDGGGVGPHFDSYDVFLLQGAGKRLWQISSLKNDALVPNAPLRILKNFKAEQEWVLEPGDMLYLPPHYAHNGIAIGDCITYSIGFRAASHNELINAFLIYLQDHLTIDGRYSDPDLKLTKHPALISLDMINKVQSVLKKITFGKKQISDFLGQYLSEPKNHIIFNKPLTPMSKKEFAKRALTHSIALDQKSLMLFTNIRSHIRNVMFRESSVITDCGAAKDHQTFYLNGERYEISNKQTASFQQLANDRILSPTKHSKNNLNHFYQWYCDGYLKLKPPKRK